MANSKQIPACPELEAVSSLRARSDAIAQAGNDLDRRFAQLNSLLTCSYGVGAEWMDEIGQENRDNILWIASDLCRAAEQSWREIRAQVAASGADGEVQS